MSEFGTKRVGLVSAPRGWAGIQPLWRGPESTHIPRKCLTALADRSCHHRARSLRHDHEVERRLHLSEHATVQDTRIGHGLTFLNPRPLQGRSRCPQLSAASDTSLGAHAHRWGVDAQPGQCDQEQPRSSARLRQARPAGRRRLCAAQGGVKAAATGAAAAVSQPQLSGLSRPDGLNSKSNHAMSIKPIKTKADYRAALRTANSRVPKGSRLDALMPLIEA